MNLFLNFKKDYKLNLEKEKIKFIPLKIKIFINQSNSYSKLGKIN